MARLEHELQHPPFHLFLRPFAKRVEEKANSISIGLRYRSEFSRSRDSPMFHGGILASLVDIAGHAAVAVLLGRMAPTIDLRLDFLRAAPPFELTATARVIRMGRHIAVVDIEVNDNDGRIVALGRGTFSTTRPDETPAATA